jgi:predicted transcriptional regulator
VRASSDAPLDEPVVDSATLARLYAEPGATGANLARRFGVAPATAARWLADAALLPLDPSVDHAKLAKLYVDGGLTIKEVAEKLGTTHARVQQGLAAAGIPARSNRARRPRGNRTRVTDRRLTDLYVRRGMSVVECAVSLGVSTEYLRKRLKEVGLTKKPGTFTPHTEWGHDELRGRAADLYEQGMSMKVAGEQLKVSSQTVRKALHEAQVPVRRGGFGASPDPGHTLIDDLYADAQIYQVLALHGVVIPDEWSATGPFESLAPLPLSKKLVKALYDMVGLPIFHISLLLGVGQGAVRSALIAAGVMFRAAGVPAPWTARRFSD